MFEKLKEQASRMDEKKMIYCMQVFAGAENELRYTLSPRLLLEALSLSAMMGQNIEDVKKN